MATLSKPDEGTSATFVNTFAVCGRKHMLTGMGSLTLGTGKPSRYGPTGRIAVHIFHRPHAISLMTQRIHRWPFSLSSSASQQGQGGSTN